MTDQDLTDVMRILKELQAASKLQQQQIDHLIVAFELKSSYKEEKSYDQTIPHVGSKRRLHQILDSKTNPPTVSNNEKDALEGTPTERKEHIDKILEKQSFQDIWKRLTVKMSVQNIDHLQGKDKIVEIIREACEKARLICGMNYDTLLTANLRRIIRQGETPDLGKISYKASNSNSSPAGVSYAHNIEMFQKNMDDFHSALEDPLQHFKNFPKKTLLMDSCFSSTAELDFRSKRQRLPFAICCIRRKGYISFFVGDWAHEDKEMPNASNFNHYATLKLDIFVDTSDLNSSIWQEFESLLENAACPSDLKIGSVTMFMHEHRGNIVCAKVMLSNGSLKPVLRLYPHCSYKTSIKPIILNFDDDGENYLKKLSVNLN